MKASYIPLESRHLKLTSVQVSASFVIGADRDDVLNRGGADAGGTGVVPTGPVGAARPRPYFVPLLEQLASPLPAPSPYAGPTGGLAERREPESRPASPVCTACTSRRVPRPRPPAVPGTHRMALRPSTAPQRVPLPSPPESSLPALADPASDSLRAASPTVTRLLATVVTDPSFESTAASALVTKLVDFAAHCRLDYATSLVAESESVCPPSVGGRPDAPDIPTPRSYAEAIECPYSSQWQAAMDAEMASWKSTSTYVDEVPPPGANIVSGMWIFRVKQPSGSPPVFKARYVARGFSQRQGVDYFQTFSPTPKMTTLRVLLHVAAQSLGLVLGGRSRVVLTGHADASWVDDLATQQSSQGYTFSLGSGSVSWRSTCSSSVLSSSCEAEIYAGAMAAQETKHIALRYFLARELQQHGQLRLAYVASQANTADIFTKALQPCEHQRFCTMLGLWLTRDAAARLAVRSHLPSTERAHFSQYKSAKPLYDGVVAHYSSPATAALSRLMLPYPFPDLAAFATVIDLITHLRTSDTHYRAALPAEDHFLSLFPPTLTVDLLEECLLAAETSITAVGASRVDPVPLSLRGAPPFLFCPPLPLVLLSTLLAPSRSALRLLLARGAAAARESGARARAEVAGEAVVAVEAEEGVGVGVVAGVGASVAAVEVEAAVAMAVGVEVAEEAAAEVELVEAVLYSGDPNTSPALVRPCRPSSFVSGTPGAGGLGFPDATEIPRWGDLLKSGVAIFDLDFDAILAAMYAVSISAEGDCYVGVPPDPGIEVAALGATESAAPGASESALSGTESAQVFHTFTLDSGASRSFFRDRTTLMPLSRLVAVSLADSSGGAVLARYSTVLPCPAAPSGSLSGLYLPSFSTNLVSGADLQDAGVDQFTHASQRVTHCTCAQTGRHLATFIRRPGSSLYTLTTESPPVAASCQVAASSKVFAAESGSPPVPPDPPLAPPPWSPLLASSPRHGLPCPSRVRGQGHDRYFLLVVDDYSRYTTVFPLRRKDEVTEVLIDWIRVARLQLRERFSSDFPVLRLHADSVGEFSSDLLRAFCRAEGIRQMFTLPASPQQNGIAERRIGMVMDVARTSMIHAAAPHFQWPFAVQYAAHQINLQPGVSLPETSPTLRWTGKVGDASVFRVWGSRALVRDLSADKLSSRAVPCVFLGFPPDAPSWQFYHPTSRRVLSSQDVTFDESVPYYYAVEPVEIAADSGMPGGAEPKSVVPRGAGSGGAVPECAEPAGAGSGGAEPGGAEPRVAESGGAVAAGTGPGARGAAGAGGSASTGGAGATGPGGARTGGTGAAGLGGATGAVTTGGAGASGAARVGTTGGAGAGAAASAGGAGAGGAAGAGAPVGAEVGAPGAAGDTPGGAGVVLAGFGGAARPWPFFVPLLEQLQLASPLPAPSPYAGPTGGLAERREPDSHPASPIRTACTSRRAPRQRPPAVPGTHQMALRPSTAPQRVPLPSPPESSLPSLADPESDSLRAASPTVTHFLVTAVTNPSFESAAASALVAELVDFSSHCRLDYATSLVAESASVCPPSVGGECALSTDVLEDRREEFQCFAAALPHLVSMLLAPEGEPDAPDIPTPRSSAEVIECPYSSQWQAAMDAEMASWKSTDTNVDEVPPPRANIVSGMWIFRVKRPPGSPPVFKARYVTRGFSQRQGVDYFQTFSPTPKMTTLREIWLRRPPGFTGFFPPGTQWSLRRPVYGLRQAPREWHDTLRTTLAALGFAPSTADPSLFLRTDTLLPPLYILVYVDDLVFNTADIAGLAHVKSELQRNNTCTDLGELRSYLSLQITRDRARRTITLTQSHMVQQVLQRFDFTYSSPQATPLSTRHSLPALPSDESVELSGPYPELVGCLMYLMTCTQPDLAYPLSILARYVAPGRHRPEHMAAAKRVLRYLCSTSRMGLVLGGRSPVVLTGHADASWVDDLATQRSSQGYTFSLGSGSVSWRSTHLSSVLSSSREAEIYAGAMAAQELRWLTYLLTDLGEPPRSPPVLYVDNKAMLALCQEHRLEHRTKHIALRYFLAREL
ncbi:unnamed protein product [Closterium sp. NIES-53]